MPQPSQGETRDDFLNRCMADGEANEDFPDPAQRYAFCLSQWENRTVNETNHDRLLAKIVSRKGGGRFGGGITTADRYVRMGLDFCGDTLAPADKIDSLLRRAAGTLVYCDPESGAEQTKRAAEIDDLLPDGIKPPKNTLMLIQHVLTTPREDRDGDILMTDGAELDPKAPLLWQHNHMQPIGVTVAKLKQTKSVLQLVSALLDLNDTTADAAKLIEADALRFSHGFRVLDWEERTNEDGSPKWGFLIKAFEIMEASLVSVPSNVDAEIQLYASGKLTSGLFKTHAKHLYDLRPVIVPGATLPPEPGATDDKGPAGEPHEPTGVGAVPSGDPAGAAGADPPVPSTTAATEPSTPVKQGRVLSQRNVDAINEAIEDLAELSDTDLTRGQKALLKGAIGKLKQVIKDSQQDDDGDDDGKGHSGPAAELPEPSLEDAMTRILREADERQLRSFAETLKCLTGLRQDDAKAAAYRRARGLVSKRAV